MKRQKNLVIAAVIGGLVALGGLAASLQAWDANEDAIKEVMKVYHKAPKGVDPICKKAADGKATTEELKKLAASYQVLAKTKAPRGDAASWTEKTTKLVAASQALLKGEPDAAAKYKEAVNCKACHSAHKPE